MIIARRRCVLFALCLPNPVVKYSSCFHTTAVRFLVIMVHSDLKILLYGFIVDLPARLQYVAGNFMRNFVCDEDECCDARMGGKAWRDYPAVFAGGILLSGLPVSPSLLQGYIVTERVCYG